MATLDLSHSFGVYPNLKNKSIKNQNLLCWLPRPPPPPLPPTPPHPPPPQPPTPYGPRPPRSRLLLFFLCYFKLFPYPDLFAEYLQPSSSFHLFFRDILVVKSSGPH